MKRNKSKNEHPIRRITHQHTLAGVREIDLDKILDTAYFEEKKNKSSSAVKSYEIVLEFISSLALTCESSISDWHRRIFIKAAERRTALAMFYPRRGNLRKWLSLAEDFAAQLGDERIQASLNLMIGQNYCVTLQVQKAVTYLQQAQSIITLLDDEELYKQSLKLQMLVHVSEGQLYRAIESYEESIGSIESFDEFFSLYAALGISFVYTEVGMPQRGLGICEAIRNQGNAHKSEAFVIEGIILFQIRQLAGSRRCFEQALEHLKGKKSHSYESVARISLICIDYLEGNISSSSFDFLNKTSKKTWHNLLNFFYIFESAYKLYHENIARFEDKNLFGFLSEIKEEQLFPRTYQMIRRLQISFSDNITAAEKIGNLLNLGKTISKGGVSFEFELASIRIELARIYVQIKDHGQAKTYARKAWKFFHPIATKAYPSDLLHLLPQDTRSTESSLINFVIEMGNALTKKDSTEQLLTSIMASISRMSGAERAALFIRNDASSELEMVASRNFFREDILKEEFKQSFADIKHVAKSNDIKISEFPIGTAGAIDTRKVIITPLMLDGKNIGALYQDSRFFHIDTSSGNNEILFALASQIAVSIDRAKAHDEIAQLNNKLIQENLYYIDEKEEFRPFGEIVGASSAMIKVQQSIGKVAPTQSAVFIQGETGVGKELVARAIHRESPRKDKPFIRVNCAALSDSLIDSELFGHERGAFTGAFKTKAGRFELAHQGTIFLDEISELPPPTQSRLLRVLQEKEFQRVGGTKLLYSDFRIITATNKDLKEEVGKGRFREDLFYRLNVYPIQVPPLRERQEDIPLLATHFLHLFSAQHNKHYSGIVASEMEKLKAYAWPGNIRELSNIIERAVIAGESKIRFPELESKKPRGTIHDLDIKITLKEREKKICTLWILEALEKSGWKIGGKNGAAELLGLKRTALVLRMKRLGIKIENKKSAIISVQSEF